MIVLVSFMEIPDCQDYVIEGAELFERFEDAKLRSDELIANFIEEYGDDYSEMATEKEPMAYAGNGDVTRRIYIREIKEISL